MSPPAAAKRPATKPSDASAAIDAYLAGLPADQRDALQKLRTTIKAAAPAAEEAWSYGMPAFRQNGGLVCYSAFKNHCSFFPMNAGLVASLASDLTRWETSKGTIKFTPDKPLPASLVKKIVKARVTENAERRARRSK